MNINITLQQAYERASATLRQKMEYSIHLLQKAEKLALAYDNRGGTTSPSAVAKTRKPCITSPNWRVYAIRDT